MTWKKIFIWTVLFIPLFTYPAIVNQIVVGVGTIAITSLDVSQMKEFDAAISQKKVSNQEALTKLINMASLLVLAESDSSYYMDEVELRKTLHAMTNNTSDPTTRNRIELYEKYSYIYRMFLRADKVKRGLIANNIRIRSQINDPVTDKEVSDFYNKNKDQMKDSPYPKLELIVFGLESSARWGLDELEQVENDLAQLAKDLDSSSDIASLRKKYSHLKFTGYTQKTALSTPDILILQDKVPEEAIGISLQPSISFGPNTLKISKNKGIYIPQPIPMRATGKPTYLVLKILNIEQPQNLSLDEARPRIEEMIRFQRAELAIENMIKERIQAGQIPLTPVDNTYSAVFKTFK